MRRAGKKGELEWRRRLAVERVEEGYTKKEVAKFLGVDPSSVYRWCAGFAQKGETGLLNRPVSGRPCKLSYTQEKIVFRWLSERPSQLGFTTDLWSAPRLTQLIHRDLGVSLHPDHLRKWLRQHGYTPQKPVRVPREQDKQAIAHWLANDWPRICTHARKSKACLMLLDESGLLMAPLLRRSWALRGHPQQLKQKTSHREKVSVAGGLWLGPRQDKVNLAWQTLVNGFFNNDTTADFLDFVMRQLKKRMVVVWDRGPMHQGDPIEELLEEWHGRLELEPLPPYSPRLMPVEFLWRSLKYDRLSNFAPVNVQHLHDSVVRELNLLADDTVLLSAFFHLSDLPLHYFHRML